MQEVKAKFAEVIKEISPDKVLGLFDVDMVLSHPSDPMVQMANLVKHYAIYKKITGSLTPEQKYIALNLAIQSSPSILVDTTAPRVVQELLRQKIKCIAFTASLAKHLSETKRNENWRYKSLKSLGFDFRTSFPHISSHTFDNKILGTIPPLFKDGVLYTNADENHLDKGKVLIAFIEKAGFIPKVVILVDDRKENLEAVANALQAFDSSIHFIGIHYTGAMGYPSQIVDAEAFEASWLQFVNTAKTVILDGYKT